MRVAAAAKEEIVFFSVLASRYSNLIMPVLKNVLEN